MNNILYEATFKFDFVLLMIPCMLIFIAVFPFILKKSWDEKSPVTSLKTVKIFCAFAFCFVLLLSVVSGIAQINMYKNVVGAYKNGEYIIVEGYVQDFVPMPYEGHSEESFEIEGVSFSYSDYYIQSGYNNSKSHGGVIEGNGQHLKIGYVVDNGENIIVYIEQLE